MAKLSENALKILSTQMNLEFVASHTYLKAAYWFDDLNYDGIFSFLKKQSDSERSHGLKVGDYITMRGNLPILTGVELKDYKWEKPLDVFQTLFNMEVEFFHNYQKISKSLREEGDEAAANFTADFLKEQEKAVDEFDTLMAKVRSYTALPGLLWHLNKELGD